MRADDRPREAQRFDMGVLADERASEFAVCDQDESSISGSLFP